MYIYIYIYIPIRICVHVYTYIYVYIRIYVRQPDTINHLYSHPDSQISKIHFTYCSVQT